MDFVAPDLNFVASACILVPTWLEARDGPMAREMAPSPLKKLDRVAGLSRDDAYPAQSVPRMVSRVQLAPLHRGVDGLKFNGGLGGPRAQPEARCCARRPGSA